MQRPTPSQPLRGSDDPIPSGGSVLIQTPVYRLAVAAMLAALHSAAMPASVPLPASPTLAQRAEAAERVATTSDACTKIRPYYWEIGDGSGMQSSGSVDKPGSSEHVTATTEMNIASSSKWLYGAYVLQRRGGKPTEEDTKFLTFRSGYTNFSMCLRRQTVQSCVNFQQNGVHSDATDGLFDYDGGHMQNHAALVMGLGPLGNKALASEMQSQLGSDIGLSYTQPQLAGGVVSSADDYARFLRKLINRELAMGKHLGDHPVCANPVTCPKKAVDTPVSLDETWHYSLGHWVEDDPIVGDGSFSSAGAFGFYPWIDATRRTYGVIARKGRTGSGDDSVDCGRQIRQAWMNGTAP
jgi:hypothetical protein